MIGGRDWSSNQTTYEDELKYFLNDLGISFKDSAMNNRLGLIDSYMDLLGQYTFYGVSADSYLTYSQIKEIVENKMSTSIITKEEFNALEATDAIPFNDQTEDEEFYNIYSTGVQGDATIDSNFTLDLSNVHILVNESAMLVKGRAYALEAYLIDEDGNTYLIDKTSQEYTSGALELALHNNIVLGNEHTGKFHVVTYLTLDDATSINQRLSKLYYPEITGNDNLVINKDTKLVTRYVASKQEYIVDTFDDALNTMTLCNDEDSFDVELYDYTKHYIDNSNLGINIIGKKFFENGDTFVIKTYVVNGDTKTLLNEETKIVGQTSACISPSNITLESLLELDAGEYHIEYEITYNEQYTITISSFNTSGLDGACETVEAKRVTATKAYNEFSFVVEELDITPPTITWKEDAPTTFRNGTIAQSLLDYIEVSDDKDEKGMISIVIYRGDTELMYSDTLESGTYTIVARDSSWNEGSVEVEITIYETEGITLTLKEDQEMTFAQDTPVSKLLECINVTDDSDVLENITYTYYLVADIDVENACTGAEALVTGSYKIYAKDLCGNEASILLMVTVEQKEKIYAITITWKENQEYTFASGTTASKLLDCIDVSDTQDELSNLTYEIQMKGEGGMVECANEDLLVTGLYTIIVKDTKGNSNSLTCEITVY